MKLQRNVIFFVILFSFFIFGAIGLYYSLFIKTQPGREIVITVQKKLNADKHIALVKQGQIEGYQFWVYENTQYPCGKSGNHEFIVLQKNEGKDKRNLFVRFHGGGFGFYKSDGTYMSIPANRTDLLYAEKERNNLFSSILDDGLVKLMRENQAWRIMMPSYCSHDLYFGRGQYSPYDGFARWGYAAAQSAIDFVKEKFPTDKIVTAGSSAGSYGAFYNGYKRTDVAGIVMDSNSILFSTSRNYCMKDIPTWCGDKNICDCYDQGKRCLENGSERINFQIGQDEPKTLIEHGQVHTPLYFIWNLHDKFFGDLYGMQNSSSNYQTTHDTVVTNNPGGKSKAQMISVTDPSAPNKSYDLHSPTEYDSLWTTDVYNWIMSLVK